MRISKTDLRNTRVAALATAIVFGAVATLSWASNAYSNTMDAGQFERYISLGSRLGTQALARDLNAEHPPGTSLVSLMARMERGGFTCQPDIRTYAGYDCSWRLSTSGSRVAQIHTHVVASGVQVVSIHPTVDVYHR